MIKKQKKILKTSGAYVVRNDRVLLVWHEKAGLWLAPGGKCGEYETLGQAAIREVGEETGLVIELRDKFSEQTRSVTDLAQELVLPQGSFLIETKFGETQEEFSFFACVTDDSREGQGEYSQKEMKWCTVWDLEEMNLQEDIKKYAIRALDMLGRK